MLYLNICTSDLLNAVVSRRAGEVKGGERLQLLEVAGESACENALSANSPSVAADQEETRLLQALQAVHQRGGRFALLGVPEDISPRANLGRGGATQAWSVFLASFANMQHNRYLDFSRLCCLGTVDCTDLHNDSEICQQGGSAQLATLRERCTQLDARVSRLVAVVCRAGLVPVVIGGGHGVAYGVMKGILAAQADPARGLAVINCDPHADFRALEGRHSGNAFSYAVQEGWLKSYQVLALHESYNSEKMLQAMEKAGVSWITYEDIFLRGKISFAAAVARLADQARATALPVGLEVDMDCLADMPSSAVLPYGLSLREVGEAVSRLAGDLQPAYLHLPEAAPELGPDGFRRVGRALAWLVSVFAKEYRVQC